MRLQHARRGVYLAAQVGGIAQALVGEVHHAVPLRVHKVHPPLPIGGILLRPLDALVGLEDEGEGLGVAREDDGGVAVGPNYRVAGIGAHGVQQEVLVLRHVDAQVGLRLGGVIAATAAREEQRRDGKKRLYIVVSHTIHYSLIAIHYFLRIFAA